MRGLATGKQAVDFFQRRFFDPYLSTRSTLPRRDVLEKVELRPASFFMGDIRCAELPATDGAGILGYRFPDGSE